MKQSEYFDDIIIFLEKYNPNIVNYHVSVLLNHEVIEIENNGLFSSNCDNILRKLNMAKDHGEITIKDLEQLTKYIAVEKQSSNSFTHAYTSLPSLVLDNRENKMLINQLWGGE